MDIYQSWLPPSLYYLVHLVLWMGPIILLQWGIAPQLLAHHRHILWKVTLSLGTYLVLTDAAAVAWEIWHFDAALILGFNPLGVPIEEWLFFYLTVLLVAQSFILFLPAHYRLATKKSS